MSKYTDLIKNYKYYSYNEKGKLKKGLNAESEEGKRYNVFNFDTREIETIDHKDYGESPPSYKLKTYTPNPKTIQDIQNSASQRLENDPSYKAYRAVMNLGDFAFRKGQYAKDTHESEGIKTSGWFSNFVNRNLKSNEKYSDNSTLDIQKRVDAANSIGNVEIEDPLDPLYIKSESASERKQNDKKLIQEAETEISNRKTKYTTQPVEEMSDEELNDSYELFKSLKNQTKSERTKSFYSSQNDSKEEFTQENEIDSKIRSIESEKQKRENESKLEEYYKLSSNPDFEKNSELKNADNLYDPSKVLDQQTDTANPLDAYVNGLISANEYYYQTGLTPQANDEFSGFQYLTEEERKIYNYLNNTRGNESAKDFLISLQDTLAQRSAEASFENVKGNKPAEVVSGFFTGGQQFFDSIDSLFSGDNTGKYYSSDYLNAYIKEDLADDAFTSTLYDLSVNLGNNAVPQILSFAAGPAGSIASSAAYYGSFGASVFGNAKNQALLEGANEQDAYLYAALNTASELGLEKAIGASGNVTGISEEKLLKKASNIRGVLPRVASTLAIRGASEFTEEALQEALSPVLERMTYDDSASTSLQDVLYAGLIGGLSGVTMSAAVNIPTDVITLTNIAQRATESDTNADALVSFAKELSQETAAHAEKVQQKKTGKDGTKNSIFVGSLAYDVNLAVAERFDSCATISEANEVKTKLDLLATNDYLSEIVNDAYASTVSRITTKGEGSINKKNKYTFSKSGNSQETEQTQQNVEDTENNSSEVPQKETQENIVELENTPSIAPKTSDSASGSNYTTKEEKADTTQNRESQTYSEEYVAPEYYSQGVVTESGEDSSVRRIKKEDGEVIAELSNGESEKVSSLTFNDEKEQALLEAASRYDDDKTANAFMRYYKKEMPVSTYINGWRMMYNYGRLGVSKEEALSRASFAVQKTNKTAMAVAYNMGVRDEKNSGTTAKLVTSKSKRTQFKEGTVTDDTGEYVNETGKEDLPLSDFLKQYAKKTGIDIVIKDEIGNEANGRILIDSMRIELSSSSNIYKTIAHETGEFALAYNKAGYDDIMKDLIEWWISKNNIPSFESAVESYIDSYSDQNEQESYQGAVNEIVNDAVSGLLSTDEGVSQFVEWVYSQNITKEQKVSILQKLKDIISKVLNEIKSYISNFISDDASAVVPIMDNLNADKIRKKLFDVLDEAIKTANSGGRYSYLQNSGAVTPFNNINVVYEDGSNVIHSNDGEVLMDVSQNNAVKMNRTTYLNGGRDELIAYGNSLVEKNIIESKDAASIVSSMDQIMHEADRIAESGEFVQFGKWYLSDLVVKDGKVVFSVKVNNGEYKINYDFSTVCKKRKWLDKVLSSIVSNDYGIDASLLSPADIVTINQAIKDHGFEIACACCFVDSKRYGIAKWASSMEENYNMVVNSLTHGKSSYVRYFESEEQINSKKNSINKDLLDYNNKSIKVYANKSQKNYTLMSVNDIISNYYNRGGTSKTEIEKIAFLLKEDPSCAHLISSKDLISSNTLDSLKINDPKIYAIVNTHQGTAKPKIPHGETPYASEVIKDSTLDPTKLYMIGGARINSFADYVPYLFFDYMQMLADLSARKAPVQSYTKEYYFAKLFGMAYNVNLSMIPAVNVGLETTLKYGSMKAKDRRGSKEFNQIKKYAGLNPDGSYCWSDQSFGYDQAKKTAGKDVYSIGNECFEIAKNLQNSNGYTKTTGICAIGISDEHIRKMLRDPDIRMVIPYHRSSLNNLVSVMNNIFFYNDYTKFQNTRKNGTPDANGHYKGGSKKGVVEKSWYVFLKENQYDAKKAANAYLEWCDKNKYTPKFEKFRNEENYYKLLVDMNAYDNISGDIARQKSAEFIIPSDWVDIVKESLSDYQNTTGNFNSDQDNLISDIKERLKKRNSRAVKESRNVDVFSGSSKDKKRIQQLKQQLDDLDLASRIHETAAVRKQKRKAENLQNIIKEKNLEIKELRSSFSEEIKSTKERYKQREEQKKNTILRNKIIGLANKFASYISNPTKSQHAPKELYKEMVSLCGIVIKGGRDTATVPFKELKEKMNNVLSIYLEMKDKEYDAYLSEVYSMMLNVFGNLDTESDVFYMNNENLNDLYSAMKALDHAISNANKIFVDGQKKEAASYAYPMMEEVNKAVWNKGKSKDISNTMKFFLYQTDPYTFFKFLGGESKNNSWVKFYYDVLNQGQRDTDRILETGRQILDKVYGDKVASNEKEKRKHLKNLKESRNPSVTYDIGLVDEKGNPIRVTKGVALGIWMDLQNEDNTKNIVFAGKIVPYLSDYYKNKKNAWGAKSIISSPLVNNEELSDLYYEIKKISRKARSSKYSEAEKQGFKGDLLSLQESYNSIVSEGYAKANAIKEKIESIMNDYDRNVVEVAKEFFEFSSEEINKTSNERFGFDMATVKNYYPIEVYRNSVRVNDENISQTLANSLGLISPGFTHSRNKNAKSITLANDIYDVMNRHLDQVSKYCGIMYSFEKMRKVFNVSTRGQRTNVRDTLRKRYGIYPQEYINKLERDALSPINMYIGDINFFGKALSNYTKAVLVINIGTFLKQPASYITAAATIPYKHLAKAMNPVVKNDSDETIFKYAGGTYAKRKRGYSTAEAGALSEQATIEGKIKSVAPVLVGIIQKGDMIATKRIWLAAKYYAQEKYNLKWNSEEHYKKTADIYMDTIERTQSNYSAIHKTGFSRTTDTLTKATIGMFQTQNQKNMSMMTDAVLEYVAAKERKNKAKKEGKSASSETVALKESRKNLAYVFSSQVLQAGMVSAVSLFIALLYRNLYRYEDDDGGITPETAVEGVMKETAETMISNMAFVGPVFTSLFYGFFNAYNGDIEAEGVSALNDLIVSFKKVSDAGGSLISAFQNGKEEEKGEATTNLLTSLQSLAKTTGNYTGIPVGSIMNYFNAAQKWAQDIADGGTLFSNLERTESEFGDRYYNAYLSGNKESVSLVIDEYSAQHPDLTKEECEAKLNKSLKSLLKQTDDVIDAANLRIEGEYSKYEEKVNGIIKETGIPEDIIKSAVESVYESAIASESGESSISTEQEKISLYSIDDIVSVLDKGDIDTANDKIIVDIFNNKVANCISDGKDEEDAEKSARSSIKSSITREYKKRWLKEDLVGKGEIEDKLKRIIVNGDYLYSSDDFDSWE